MSYELMNYKSMLDALTQRLKRDHEIVFLAKVRPGAAKTQVKSVMADDTVKIDVAAAPEDGKANKELIRYLAEAFFADRRDIEILSGQTAAIKAVRIRKM